MFSVEFYHACSIHMVEFGRTGVVQVIDSNFKNIITYRSQYMVK